MRSGSPLCCRRVARLALVLLLVAGGCRTGTDELLDEARTLHEHGQVREAIAVLRAALDREPTHPEANLLLGAVLLQTGQPVLATKRLEVAVASPEHAVEGGLLLASAFYTAGNYASAIDAASKVIELRPDDPGALRIRASSRLQTGAAAESLADIDRLLELAPDDPHARGLRGTALAQLGRFDEAEATFREIKRRTAASGDPALAARGCAALARYFVEARPDPEQASREFDACLAEHPADAWVVQPAVQHYDAQGQPERALAALRGAVEARPDQLGFRLQLAQRLQRMGRGDEADALLVEAAERLGTPEAWNVVAGFRRGVGRYDAALEAIGTALKLADAKHKDMLSLTRADILLDAGRLDEAEAASADIETSAYRDLVQGRLLLLRGDASGALETLERGAMAWPNNPAAHFLVGTAAEAAGQPEKALAAYQSARAADPRATDAALRAARLSLALGRTDAALALAQAQLAARASGRVEAELVIAAAYDRSDKPELAVRALEAAIHNEGPDPRLVATLATEKDASGGADAAIAAIDGTGIDLDDPANQAALRAYAQVLVDAGRGDAALTRVGRALTVHPDSAVLYEVKGRTLAALGRTDAAHRSLERALELDPQSAGALASLGSLEAQSGDPRALALLDRAARLDPTNPDPAYLAAQLLLASGDSSGSETRLRELLRLHPGHANACNDLAWLLAQDGRDLDTALTLARRAVAIAPRPEMLDTLGWVLIQRGQAAEAVEPLQRAAEASPGSPGIRYRLGLALAAEGHPDEALAAFQDAVDAGPFPEADIAREKIAQLERRAGPGR